MEERKAMNGGQLQKSGNGGEWSESSYDSWSEGKIMALSGLGDRVTGAVVRSSNRTHARDGGSLEVVVMSSMERNERRTHLEEKGEDVHSK